MTTDDLDLTKKLQNKELEMLKSLTSILDRNEIKYTLAFGTALGCVRHNGFIPWDDDIDIHILGKDYPKLKKVFEEQDTGNLRLHDFQTVKNYPFVFPKVVAADTLLIEKTLEHVDYRGGVYIDVFPLIETSDVTLIRKFQDTIRYFKYVLIRAYYHNFNNVFRKIFSCVVRKLINPYAVQKSLYKQYIIPSLGKKYFLEVSSFRQRALLKKDIFTGVKLNKFEDASFYIPKDYDQYLTHFYKDYMTLPPIEARISNHDFSKIEFYK